MSIDTENVSNSEIRDQRSSSAVWSSSQGNATGSKEGLFNGFWDRAVNGAQKFFNFESKRIDEELDEGSKGEKPTESRLHNRLSHLRSTGGFGSRLIGDSWSRSEESLDRIPSFGRVEQPVRESVDRQEREPVDAPQRSVSTSDENKADDLGPEDAVRQDLIDDEEDEKEKRITQVSVPLLPAIVTKATEVSAQGPAAPDSRQNVSDSKLATTPSPTRNAPMAQASEAVAQNPEGVNQNVSEGPGQVSNSRIAQAVATDSPTSPNATETKTIGSPPPSVKTEGQSTKAPLTQVPAVSDANPKQADGLVDSGKSDSKQSGVASDQSPTADGDRLSIDEKNSKRVVSKALRGASMQPESLPTKQSSTSVPSQQSNTPVASGDEIKEMRSGLNLSPENGDNKIDSPRPQSRQRSDPARGNHPSRGESAHAISEGAAKDASAQRTAQSVDEVALQHAMRKVSQEGAQVSGNRRPATQNQPAPLVNPSMGSGLNGQVNATSMQQGQSSGNNADSHPKQDLATSVKSSMQVKGGEKTADSTTGFDLSSKETEASRRSQIASKARMTSYSSRTSEEVKEVFKTMSNGVERMQASRQTSMNIRINFDQGGSMNLKLSIDNGQVNSSMQTDLPGLENLIKSSWNELATELNQKGLRIGNPQFAGGADSKGEGFAAFDQKNDSPNRSAQEMGGRGDGGNRGSRSRSPERSSAAEHGASESHGGNKRGADDETGGEGALKTYA